MNENSAADERTFDPDDPFRPGADFEPTPTEQEATGETKVLPPGDYLVKVLEMEHDTFHGEEESWENCNGKMVVVEPKEFAGRYIFDRVRLWKKGEPDWCRRKRYGIIIRSGHAEEGDGEAIARHYWPDMIGSLYCFRLGQVKMFSETENKNIIRNEPADFIGWFPESHWQSEDVQKAPQDWDVRDRTEAGKAAKKKKGGSKSSTSKPAGGADEKPKKDLPQDL